MVMGQYFHVKNKLSSRKHFINSGLAILFVSKTKAKIVKEKTDAVNSIKEKKCVSQK